MRHVYPRMTESRRAFLVELEAMGCGEPKMRGTARHHLIRLGWIQGAVKMPDGRVLTDEQFDAERPRCSENRWLGVTFYGVAMTPLGRTALAEYD